jgi:hypothetical protein
MTATDTSLKKLKLFLAIPFLRFSSRPPQTMLESLKAAGWRWSKFAACWWIKDSPSARGFASLFGSVA